MSKRTRLTEKSVRIPDTRQMRRDEAIPRYLQEVEPMSKESARSHRFAMLVQEFLSVEPDFVEKYAAGIEQFLKVKQKDRILKGQADNLFGNVIIEFEACIPKKRAEAEEQLRRYVAILWSQEPPDARTPYLCVATDGVRFLTYSPTLSDLAKSHVTPDDIRLHVLEETDWAKLEPDQVFYWLDRYFLRKEVLRPTSEAIASDFGVRSHAFQTTTNTLLGLWQEIKTQSDCAVIYASWEKYLLIVYGSAVARDELFIRHTYLATLAKPMSWARVSEMTSLPEDAQIVDVLEGRFFKAQGIENFIEEDFFSWLGRGDATKTGVAVVRWLFSLLQNYRLRELSEDVLKALYQELVDPETRHDLGEFYTPDWLAHLVTRKLLDTNARGALLDPACGSGTFLYLAIREKRGRLGDSVETLRHILDTVYGADVHPLAVIVAKTNYVLALGDLLKKRQGKITIPVYLADTLKLPEFEKKAKMVVLGSAFVEQMPGYRVELDGQEVHLPEQLIQNVSVYDQAIELAKDFALQSKGKTIAHETFHNFLTAQRFSGAENKALVHALFAIAAVLKSLIDADRDTIWAFVLKNIYKPLFFKRKFDFVVGNPPWIAFRYLEPAYQAFLKRQITQGYRLLTGRAELVTHLEIATLFLVRAADLYLKKGGTVAFVLPRSVFSADQHDGLRKRGFKFSEDTGQNLLWREIWDCENVTPLFNVPSCVLLAEKREGTKKAEGPISGQIIAGALPRRNASLDEAEAELATANTAFWLQMRGKRSYWTVEEGHPARGGSFYRSRFAQGATIVPRSFWFVRVKPSPVGFNPELPPLETDPRALKEAKPPYRDVKLQGNVESRFLYATLLSADLVPFGHLGYRLVVLPIQPEAERYRLIDASKARERGFLHLAQWLEAAGEEWRKRRGAKAEQMSLYERLDRVHGLTRQNPQTKFRTIYNTSGTFLAAAVVEEGRIEFAVNGQQIVARGFVVDCKNYYCELKDEPEACFLAAILNAPETDRLIKPMQSRGLWGPRDIHKKVLDLPIPKFDATEPAHVRLAELGQECGWKVEQWLANGGVGGVKSIGRLRSIVRDVLRPELAEIDGLVKEILK